MASGWPLTITSAGGHVRYRVPGMAAEGVTLDELAGHDPELSEQLRRAMASGAGGRLPFLDASRPAPNDASIVGVPAIDASRGGMRQPAR
jgi:hypothetical protein